MRAQDNLHYIQQFWEKNILPTLMEYIKIPNKSPSFDHAWRAHGYMEQAVELISNWCRLHAVENMTVEVIRLGERTPVIFIDIAGDSDETILLYGHLDKQPEMTGWDTDLDPWKPVLRGDHLYGRGAADDGYAVFAALAAIKSLHAQQLPHARCVILIEACEESGSLDLSYYLEALSERLRTPNLIICLDSGAGNYEQFWITTSLRGLVNGILSIDVLKHGIHSGIGSGIVPSCQRILRLLLDRIENMKTGDIILQDLHVEIPKQRHLQIERAAAILEKSLVSDLPFLSGVDAESASILDLLLRSTWQPALAMTGCNGIPAIENAGNVTLPSLAVKLSMRLPPTCVAEEAAHTLKMVLEKNPPYHAKVAFSISEMGSGWDAPIEEPWLAAALNRASQNYFGKEAAYLGEGGSIPFMKMLAEKYPHTQFLITGVLGPHSNAHGPNEFLHIPMVKKVTACIAQVIAEQYQK